MGNSEPFCNSNSATGKAFREACAVPGRGGMPGEVAGDAEADGDAGSAAASARNTT